MASRESEPASIPIEGRAIQSERLRQISLHQQHFGANQVFLFAPEPSAHRAGEAFMSARVKERAFLAAGFRCTICRIGEQSAEEALTALKSSRGYFIVQRPLTAEQLGLAEMDLLNLEKGGAGESRCSALTETVLRIIEPFVTDAEAAGAISVGVAGNRGYFGREISLQLISRGVEVSGCDVGEGTDCLAAASIVISAIGKPWIISKTLLRTRKELLIDVGYTYDQSSGRAFGDFDPSCYELSRYHTPVPGGVGPLQVLTLVERAAAKSGHLNARPWASPCKPFPRNSC